MLINMQGMVELVRSLVNCVSLARKIVDITAQVYYNYCTQMVNIHS